MGDVGTTKVFEDEKIAVWEFVLEPGERTPVHTHTRDYVFYVLEGSRLEVFDEHGAELGAFDANTGAVFALVCRDGEIRSRTGDGLRAPATHAARNAGPTRYREILVETK